MELNTSVFLALLVIAFYHYYPKETDSKFKTRDVPQNELEKEYDFIIVGAGSAGCVLANRLTENPAWTVLLIEAGGDETPLTYVPLLFFQTLNTEVDWNYTTVPQKRGSAEFGGITPYPRGHVMGGSSSINGMMYVRGSKRDYDDWAKLGNKGWNYDEVLPYFIKAEKATEPNLASSPYHGTEGPLNVQYARYFTRLVEDYINAGQELGWIHRDYNGAMQDNSIDIVQSTIKGPLKDSASTAYLNPIRKRKNLSIIKRSFVLNILFDESNKIAIGVKYMRNGKTYKIKSRKEVILSSGVINTPKILMLSGIGPKTELIRYGLKVISDLPVGKMLKDHAGPFITFEINKNITISKNVWETVKSIQDYTKYRNGPLTATGVEVTSFINVDELKEPANIQYMFVSTLWNKPGGNEQVIGVIINLGHPKSAGSLKLKSADPFDHPLIDLNYFSVESDYKIVRKAVELLIFKYMKTHAMRKYSPRLFLDNASGCRSLDIQNTIDCLIDFNSVNSYHGIGTARMGPKGDSEAVVSPKLLVKGFKNLRVVDASVMPNSIMGNINGPVIMIAEKAADIIKYDHLPAKYRNSQNSYYPPSYKDLMLLLTRNSFKTKRKSYFLLQKKLFRLHFH